MFDQTERGLEVLDLVVRFDRGKGLDGLSFNFAEGEFTAILGPNGCGKSTLLRAMARVQKPTSGCVNLGGVPLSNISNKVIAKRIGFLPQNPVAPVNITVHELVSRGRTPHLSLLRRWSKADSIAVQNALELTNLNGFRDTSIHNLSGGQRQRAWIAMVLAQEAEILLLDEPTTFLDINHQLETMRLIQRLTGAKKTVIAVLHDLNMAARYANQVLLMHRGKMLASGRTAEVLTEANLFSAFELETKTITDPLHGTPLLLYK